MEAATVTTETREPQIPADKLGMRISDGAVAFAKEKLAKRGTPDAAIRLGIKGGGCSGFSYVIQFEDDPPRERDRVYDIEGVRFIVDKKSLIYLAGSLLAPLLVAAVGLRGSLVVVGGVLPLVAVIAGIRWHRLDRVYV